MNKPLSSEGQAISRLKILVQRCVTEDKDISFHMLVSWIQCYRNNLKVQHCTVSESGSILSSQEKRKCLSFSADKIVGGQCHTLSETECQQSFSRRQAMTWTLSLCWEGHKQEVQHKRPAELKIWTLHDWLGPGFFRAVAPIPLTEAAMECHEAAHVHPSTGVQIELVGRYRTGGGRWGPNPSPAGAWWREHRLPTPRLRAHSGRWIGWPNHRRRESMPLRACATLGCSYAKFDERGFSRERWIRAGLWN